jgi:hypothetical protein
VMSSKSGVGNLPILGVGGGRLNGGASGTGGRFFQIESVSCLNDAEGRLDELFANGSLFEYSTVLLELCDR